MRPIFAHQGGADETLGAALLFAAVVLGWIGVDRLRGRGFHRVPKWGATLALVAGGLLIVAAVTVPAAIFPTTTARGPRPASTASISFGSPQPGQIIENGRLQVDVVLEGARIVEEASTNLEPDAGHVHVSVDGEIVSMSYGLHDELDVSELGPGAHLLQAEFVAADHGPFDPRVIAKVDFVTESSE
jgi:hypothetical protein